MRCRKKRKSLNLIDDIKVVLASTVGIGNWWVTQIDLFLKISISLATLTYIVLKIRQLLQNNK